MSDEFGQGQQKQSQPQKLAVSNKWGDPISEEWQAELQGYLDQWQAETDHGKRQGSFDGVQLTGADVFWIMARAWAVKQGKAGGETISTQEEQQLARRNPDQPLQLWLDSVHLEGAKLQNAHLESAYLEDVHFEGVCLESAHLERSTLARAHLEQANLKGAQLQGAYLGGTWLVDARLDNAYMRGVVFDDATRLNNATLSGARVAEVRWDSVNLTVLDWDLAPELGDEFDAWALITWRIKGKTRKERNEQKRKQLEAFKVAVRANRQLATMLLNQGMNEEAANYSERALRLQQRVFGLQGRRGRALWWLFLDWLAGYGYRPERTVAWYVASVGFFAILYFFASRGYITFGLKPSQFVSLPWYESLVLSLSSFHGRGFFQPLRSLGDPVAIIAAAEAVVGLMIEISFIATFTQRFFGR